MKLLGFKSIHFIFGMALSLVIGFDAFAVTNLKKVQITDGSQIDLFFDNKINPAQIKTEFFNDIIQLSLTDVSVYPAKITSVSGMDLTKVFAYQYAPKLVRCRLSVKGKAEDFQNRFQIKAGGKVLSLRISGGAVITNNDKISKSAAHAEVAAVADPQEKALLDRVLKSETKEAQKEATKGAAKEAALKDAAVKEAAREAAKERQQKAEKAAEVAKDAKDAKEEQHLLTGEGLRENRKTLGGAKPLPSPFRSLGILMAVIGLFGMIMLAIKRVKGTPNLQKHKGLSGLLGKLGTSMGGKGKMIEVVATHYLGPKKSIAMVRIQGRMLVLGCTQESINLISEFRADENGGVGEDFDVSQFTGNLTQALGGAGASAAYRSAASNLVSSQSVHQNQSLQNQGQHQTGPSFGGQQQQAELPPRRTPLNMQGSSKAGAQSSAAANFNPGNGSNGTYGQNRRPVVNTSTDSYTGNAPFADLLQAEATRPGFSGQAQGQDIGQSRGEAQNPNRSALPSVRDQIKNRMEGMKQL